MVVATGLRFLLPWKHTLSLERTENMCLCTLVVTICCCLQAAPVYVCTQVSLCVGQPGAGRLQWLNVEILCVRTEGTHLSLEGVYDEVQRMRLDTLDTLLHHVVTVLILHALQHMAVQLPHHLALQGGGWRWGRARGRNSETSNCL